MRFKRTKRFLQLVTGIHRIHHVAYSYGWLVGFGFAYFGSKGWRNIVTVDYHDCTLTGVY